MVTSGRACRNIPEGVLERQGPNTQNADCICFNDPTEVGLIRAYLVESMGHAAAAIKALKSLRKIELAEKMIEAMDEDPELVESFHALT